MIYEMTKILNIGFMDSRINLYIYIMYKYNIICNTVILIQLNVPMST